MDGHQRESKSSGNDLSEGECLGQALTMRSLAFRV